MPRVHLATFNLMPEGEPGGASLTGELAARGIDASWVRWDDETVDWPATDLVAVRSTWDYSRRLPEFLAWARRVENATSLLNGVAAFEWNASKAYLLELADVVPTVPSTLLDDATLTSGLGAALARWGRIVVKPCVGAGGVGLVVVDHPQDPELAGLTAGPWLAQPTVDSVRTVGESSVFVLAGAPVAQVDKKVAGDEVRVHERYGGSSHPVDLDPARADVASAAVAAATEVIGADLAYARVDLMQWEGDWAVSEVELIEPGLYLDVAPEIAGHFAELVSQRLDHA